MYSLIKRRRKIWKPPVGLVFLINIMEKLIYKIYYLKMNNFIVILLCIYYFIRKAEVLWSHLNFDIAFPLKHFFSHQKLRGGSVDLKNEKKKIPRSWNISIARIPPPPKKGYDRNLEGRILLQEGSFKGGRDFTL